MIERPAAKTKTALTEDILTSMRENRAQPRRQADRSGKGPQERRGPSWAVLLRCRQPCMLAHRARHPLPSRHGGDAGVEEAVGEACLMDCGHDDTEEDDIPEPPPTPDST